MQVSLPIWVSTQQPLPQSSDNVRNGNETFLEKRLTFFVAVLLELVFFAAAGFTVFFAGAFAGVFFTVVVFLVAGVAFAAAGFFAALAGVAFLGTAFAAGLVGAFALAALGFGLTGFVFYRDMIRTFEKIDYHDSIPLW